MTPPPNFRMYLRVPWSSIVLRFLAEGGLAAFLSKPSQALPPPEVGGKKATCHRQKQRAVGERAKKKNRTALRSREGTLSSRGIAGALPLECFPKAHS